MARNGQMPYHIESDFKQYIQSIYRGRGRERVSAQRYVSPCDHVNFSK